MQNLKKNKNFNLIMAIIFYIFGIFLVIDHYLWPKLLVAQSITFYLIGVLFILYSVTLFFKLLKINQNKNVQIFLFIEFVINIVCSVLIMVQKQGSLYIGIILYLRGLNELICHYITKYNKLSRFILAIILLTVAVFMISSKIITDNYFLYFVFAMVFAFAIYFTFIYMKLPKKAKKTKTKTKKNDKTK